MLLLITTRRLVEQIERAAERLKSEKFFIPEIKFSTDLYAPAWTDGEYVYVNPIFCHKASEEELYWMLKHELYHIILKHKEREKGKIHPLWIEACDYEINSILGEKVTRIFNGFYNPKFKNKSAEEIYKLLILKNPLRALFWYVIQKKETENSLFWSVTGWLLIRIAKFTMPVLTGLNYLKNFFSMLCK